MAPSSSVRTNATEYTGMADDSSGHSDNRASTLRYEAAMVELSPLTHKEQ